MNDEMKFTVRASGKTLHCQVSLCSVRHRGYGLQITIGLRPDAADCEVVFDLDPSADAYQKPPAVLLPLAKAQVKRYLAKYGIGPVEAAAERGAKLIADMARADEQRAADERQAQARRDAKYRAKGFTHRVNGWVHPQYGSDYQVEAYCMDEPDAATIRRIFAASTVENDHTITQL